MRIQIETNIEEKQNYLDPAFLEVAATIVKTVDKTIVNLQDQFYYTINASFSGLTGQVDSATITDFIPEYLNYTLPPIVDPLKGITETPVAGGTNIVFDFGTVTNLGIAVVLTLACQFKAGTDSGTTFINEVTFDTDGEIAQTTAEPVVLTLVEDFDIEKTIAVPTGTLPSPGGTVIFKLNLINHLKSNGGLGDQGAKINNIVITDVLPSGLTLDTNFTPIGYDISGQDTTYNELTGTAVGDTVNFTLPSYYGTSYAIYFRATVDSDVTVGQVIQNSAQWTVDSVARTEAIQNITIGNAVYGGSIGKYGPSHASAGNKISYELYMSNYGNQTLANTILEENIPSEIVITKIDTGKYVINPINVDLTGNLTLEYQLQSDPGNYISLGSYAENLSTSIDLVPITPSGDKITKIKFTFPELPVGAQASDAPTLDGYILEDTASGTNIDNNATLTWNTATGTGAEAATINTLVDGISVMEIYKWNNPSGSVVPGSTIRYGLTMEAGQSQVNNPIVSELLPIELDYVGNEYFAIWDYFTQSYIDSNNPSWNTIPINPPEIITDFNGTGRTLIRYTFAPDFAIEQRGNFKADFDTVVKVGAKGTINNTGIAANFGADSVAAYNPYTDSLDIDGDGVVGEELAESNIVSNEILFYNSIASDKKVKGALDVVYTEEPNVGLTYQGGSVDYKLTVTNTGNVDLESFEIVDILPHIGDTGVIVEGARESQFTVFQIGAISVALEPMESGDPEPVLEVEYSESYDPVRFAQTNFGNDTIGTVNDWTSVAPTPITNVKSFKLTSVDTKLKPGQSLVIDVECIAPLGVQPDLVAWNSFALRGSYLDQNGEMAYLLPVEPEKVGVKVQLPSADKVALGDYVWVDLNQNGIQDDGEPGINGVTVKLYAEDGTTLIGTTVTASDINGNDGYYLFNNLDPACYFVEFELPSGYVFTLQNQGGDPAKDSDANPETGRTDLVCVQEPGTSDLTIDAGLIEGTDTTTTTTTESTTTTTTESTTTESTTTTTESTTTESTTTTTTEVILNTIGDYVWDDLNKNGIQDEDEPGIAGLVVELIDVNGEVIDTITTNESGNYLFTELPDGCYKVHFGLLEGYVFTLPFQGDNPELDSNADIETGLSNEVCVKGGQIDLTIDAGMYLAETTTTTTTTTSTTTTTTTTTAEPPSNPMLSLTKSVSCKYAVVGDKVIYKVIAKNTGLTPLENVIVSDLLSGEVKFIVGSLRIDNILYPNENITAGVNIGYLNIDQSKIVTFEVEVLKYKETPIINVAKAEFEYESTIEECPTEIGMANSNKIELILQKLDISIVKEASSKYVSLNDIISYTVRIVNNGEINAICVVFKDTLSELVELLEGTFTIDGKTVNSVDLTKEINIGNVNVGQTVIIEYEAKVVKVNCAHKAVNIASINFKYILPNGKIGKDSRVSNEVVGLINYNNFKQITVDGYLDIPDVKPDMVEINEIKAEAKVLSANVIKTQMGRSIEGQRISGYKLVVTGMLNQIIVYTADMVTQAAHSAHYSNRFSTFIILPPEYKPGARIDVEGIVEDIYYNIIDSRTFFSNVAILVTAKVLDN